jgi:hypothetical protein
MKNYYYQNTIFSPPPQKKLVKPLRIVKKELILIPADNVKVFNESISTDASLIKPGQKLYTLCRIKVMDSIKQTKYP